MKKKGFTLIELLAVIVILGIILSISVVAVSSIMKKQKGKNERNALLSIFTAAKLYCAENPQENNCKTNNLEIPVDYLVNSTKHLQLDDKMIATDGIFNNKKVMFEFCHSSDGSVDYLHRKYYIDFEFNFSDGTSHKFNDCGCVDQSGVYYNSSGDMMRATIIDGLCKE